MGSQVAQVPPDLAEREIDQDGDGSGALEPGALLLFRAAEAVEGEDEGEDLADDRELVENRGPRIGGIGSAHFATVVAVLGMLDHQ